MEKLTSAVWFMIMFCLQFHSVVQVKQYGLEENRIIIIGAGVAGIAAAATLHEMGHSNILILEGSSRVGGRVKEVKLGEYTVETGAQWIHGLGNNPVLDLIRQYNVSYRTTDYEDFRIYDEDGTVITEKSQSVYEKFETVQANLEKIRASMLSYQTPDTTLRQVLKTSGWIPKSPLEDAVEYYDFDFEFTFSPDSISAKYGTDKPNYKVSNSTPGVDAMVNDLRGYSYPFRKLLSKTLRSSSDSAILLNKVVTHVHQNGNHVTVRTSDDKSYVGQYVISTVSIGVMQSRSIQFEPSLPNWKMNRFDQFQMGVFTHMYFQFPFTFWDDKEYLIYASSRRGYYTIWVNIEKLFPNSRILQATLVGEEARRIDRMSDEDIKNEVLSVLRNIFFKKNIVIPEPDSYVIPRWLSDPLFKGSFSNWTPGFTEDMKMTLCNPFGRLFFAGEACSKNSFGFVQGAYKSGKLTAKNLLDCMNDSCKTC